MKSLRTKLHGLAAETSQVRSALSQQSTKAAHEVRTAQPMYATSRRAELVRGPCAPSQHFRCLLTTAGGRDQAGARGATKDAGAHRAGDRAAHGTRHPSPHTACYGAASGSEPCESGGTWRTRLCLRLRKHVCTAR